MSANKPLVTWEAAVQWLREQPGSSEHVHSAYYDDPLLAAAERYRASDEWHEIRRWLPAAGMALDIGAGRGIASYALAKEGLAVTALEPDPSALVGAGAIRALAREAGLTIDVIEEFSEQLMLPDASFDVVFARAVLHHTTDLEAACREFFRVLKPGGRLIAVREHVISRREDLEAFLRSHPLQALYGGENAFLLREYTDAITKAGFVLRAVVRPLESPMNYAPHTPDSLRDEVTTRLARMPGSRSILRTMLSSATLFRLTLRLISMVDNRPGRLYSFIGDKR